MIPERLLTKQTVADILGYHPQTIMRLVREDKFPKPLKVSGVKSAVRFRARDVADWIDRQISAAEFNPGAAL